MVHFLWNVVNKKKQEIPGKNLFVRLHIIYNHLLCLLIIVSYSVSTMYMVDLVHFSRLLLFYYNAGYPRRVEIWHFCPILFTAGDDILLVLYWSSIICIPDNLYTSMELMASQKARSSICQAPYKCIVDSCFKFTRNATWYVYSFNDMNIYNWKWICHKHGTIFVHPFTYFSNETF